MFNFYCMQLALKSFKFQFTWKIYVRFQFTFWYKFTLDFNLHFSINLRYVSIHVRFQFTLALNLH